METRIVTLDGALKEGCERCIDTIENPQRYDRGGISGYEEPNRQPLPKKPKRESFYEVCGNPVCAKENPDPTATIPNADGRNRCRQCHSFFQKWNTYRITVMTRWQDIAGETILLVNRAAYPTASYVALVFLTPDADGRLRVGSRGDFRI